MPKSEPLYLTTLLGFGVVVLFHAAYGAVALQRAMMNEKRSSHGGVRHLQVRGLASTKQPEIAEATSLLPRREVGFFSGRSASHGSIRTQRLD